MSSELTQVGNQFTAVVDAIQSQFPNLDYRIAVLLAHSDGSRSGRLWKPSGCADRVLVGNSSVDFETQVRPKLSFAR